VFLSSYFINYVSGYIARMIGHKIYLNYYFMTSNAGNWVINGISHILMLGISILVLMLFYKKNLHQIGFNFRNNRKSFKYIKWFCIISAALLTIGTIIPFIVSNNYQTSLISSYHSISTTDKIEEILYMLIIPGIGEEPLYRAFVMIALMKLFKGNLKVGNVKIPSVVFISTIFFMYAHIGNTISPFNVTNINMTQQVFCVITGLFFGWVYYDTESLVPVIIMHNFLDVVVNALQFIVPFVYLKMNHL
jgi:membrane protease YdiL (CAAX protease family)